MDNNLNTLATMITIYQIDSAYCRFVYDHNGKKDVVSVVNITGMPAYLEASGGKRVETVNDFYALIKIKPEPIVLLSGTV